MKKTNLILAFIVVVIILIIITKGGIIPLLLIGFAIVSKKENKERIKQFFKTNFHQSNDDFKNKPNKVNLNFNQSHMDNIKNAITESSAHFKKIFLGAIILILGGWLLIKSLIIIRAQETGVYTLFGQVDEKELSSGIHLVNPLGIVYRMNIQTQEYTMSKLVSEGKVKGNDAIQVLSKEGLTLDLDVTVLYKLNEERASNIYKELGLNYEDKVVRPEIRSTIREVIAKYEAKDIYSDKRADVNKEIESLLKDAFQKRGIVLENVLLRNVELPPSLAQAISEKLQAEQEAQKYDFVLDKEKKEKERKIVEAEGQRDAQKIINESLSPNYLNYLYIQELKNRPGTIYVPTNPQTGMPVFVQGQ